MWSVAAFGAAKPSPNVVVITIDTLRADHLGCYGYKQIKTPNVDALAVNGTRFDHAYTPVPVTLPAHTVIFTGTYPMLSGIHDFSANKLNPEQPTLASVLREHGYTTGAVIGSAVLDSRFGLNHGFDFYYDHFDFSRLEESNLDEMERSGNLVADQTLEWLSKNLSKKLFLWMHLYD
ncbi:MAG TPA: sulfatase-like hydrolase/transferase, partial [Terriglobales bacterium]|nr:sulfatase-like hydrolase/transferase [Terriglobales bacterium]